MAQAFLKRSVSSVFQPFYRLEASRNQITGGSGLGLAVVQQLSATHGWQIDIKDSQLGGAAFHWCFADSQAARKNDATLWVIIAPSSWVIAEIFALPLIQNVTKKTVAEMLWKLGNWILD